MTDKKIALITGITGQDGSYLTELLLEKDYIVHGIIRRSSSFNTKRIDHIYNNSKYLNKSFFLHYGDLTDTISVYNLVNKIKPDEIYNLAAQSHVKVSFDLPEYTYNVTAAGALRLLDSIKSLGLIGKTKFYQASTSELYGNSGHKVQNEDTPFMPRSPYAVAKLYAHAVTINYREAYDMFACSGILFNHESPRRGDTFVTKKIVKGLCNIFQNNQECLYLGNINAKRDWGHAKDYVVAMWLMLQQETPDEYVIASGKQYSVKEFVSKTADCLGMNIKWEGEGLNEVAIYNNKKIIKISNKFFRPTEVDSLIGDSQKAIEKLAWKREYTIDGLIEDMVNCALKDSNA
ncbi:MAG: GDP-mannose 4,6-dehydratase [Methylophilaceae bacterium]|nr:GDP-mannose 4,6-dehydratase [Methylophilaceae bacterium]